MKPGGLISIWNSKVAGTRRERSVRRHRQGCRPGVLKFAEVIVQHVLWRPSSVVPYSKGKGVMLECAALSIGVHGRCFHGWFQNPSMWTFIWIIGDALLAPNPAGYTRWLQ